MAEKSMEERFNAVCLKLFGPEVGKSLEQWIRESRPRHFQEITAQVMVPVWEMDKVDLRTKILCCISLFTGLNRKEVKFFFQMAAYHGIPQEEVEEILLLTGLEAGFPTAENAVVLMKEAYEEQAAKSVVSKGGSK